MEKQTVCIFCLEASLKLSLENQLRNQYKLLFPATTQRLVDFLKKREVACIIANPMQNGKCHLWEFREIKSNFKIIPLIIACASDDFECLKNCADTFVDDCIEVPELDLIGRVESAIARGNFLEQHLATATPAIHYPPRIKQALKIIHLAFPKIKFAKDVSSQLGISVNTFQKEFRKYLGTTFTQYLIRLKLLYSTYLDQNDGLSGKAIAQRCGFQDEHEFYRCFKKKLGMSFSKYRSKYTSRQFNQFYKSQPH